MCTSASCRRIDDGHGLLDDRGRPAAGLASLRSPAASPEEVTLPLPLPLFLPLTLALPLTRTLTKLQSDLQRRDAALLREEKGHGPLELRQVNLDAEIVASKLRATALEAQHYLLWQFSP